MRRRVFIGINLPPEVKKRLGQKIEKWRDLPPHQKVKRGSSSGKREDFWCGGLPVRWTLEDNLHITLAFLGYVDDEKLPQICSAVKKATEQSEVFEINLNKIILGPDEKRARMIWAVGEKSEELKILAENIEKNLGIFSANKKEFRPHITLGRIGQEKWKKLETIPAINEKVNFIIPVDSVEILESVFEKGKRKYLLLENCPLR